MKFLFTFVVLSIINVVFSTIRSITTIKSGKIIASLISGGYFAFYNVMIIYTVADFPLWQKCLITFICNVIGVYAVKLVEEKTRKEKLWRVSANVPTNNIGSVVWYLNENNISFTKIDTSDINYSLIDIYCPTSKESIKVKKLLENYKAKFFVTESLNL